MGNPISKYVFRKKLVSNVSVVALSALIGGNVFAAEITNNDTVAASDTAGLIESNETGTVNVTLDSNGGAITLGADSTNSVDVTESGGVTNLVISVDQSGAANGVTFAGDVDTNGNAGDTVVINVVDDNVTFQGNIKSTTGTAAADINLGSGVADPTIVMTVDTVNNEDLTIEAIIDAVDAADTVGLKISNSDSGNSNKVTFESAIGSNEALDTIEIDADTTVTFNSTVNSGRIILNSENVTSFSDNVTGQVEFGTDGTAKFESSSSITVTGEIQNTTDNFGRGTLDVNSDTTFTGDIGVFNSRSLSNLEVADGVSVTFNTGGQRVSVSTTLLEGETSTVNLSGANMTVFTDFEATTAGEGIINVLEDTTFDSSVGQFGSANAIGTLNIADGKTASFSTARYANQTINVENLIIHDAAGDDAGILITTHLPVTIKGDIQVAVAGGNGLITVGLDDRVEFEGNIGTSTHTLGKLTGRDNEDTTVRAKGNLYIDDIDIEGKLQFDNASDVVVSGVVDSLDAGGTGNLEFNGSNVTFNSKVGSNQTLSLIKATANGQATFSDTFSATSLESAGKITLDTSDNTVTTATFTDGATINIGSNFTLGQVALKAATFTDVTSGQVNVTVPSSFKEGDVIVLFEDTDSDVTASGISISDFSATDSVFYKNAIQLGSTVSASGSLTGDDTQWIITAAEKTVDEITNDLKILSSQADSLKIAHDTTLTSGDAAALSAFNTAIAEGTSTATSVAKQIGVQDDILDGVVQSIIRSGTETVRLVSNQLAVQRTGQQYANDQSVGLAAGDQAHHNAGWVKAFGNWAAQDDDGLNAGFEADTTGVAFGLDTEISDGIRLGGSVSYATTDVDGQGAGNSEVDIESYQFTIYGDYTTDQYYLEAAVGYGINENETQRILNFGGLNRTVTGEYDSQQFIFDISAGMPISLEKDMYITPLAGFAYTHVSSDSYTETGGGNLNIQMDPDNVDVAIASVGAKIHKVIDHGDGVMIPSLRAGISYDLAGDEATATATYTGGGTAFAAEGAEVEELGFNLGFGVGYQDEIWALNINYDAEFKSNYDSHSATVEAKFLF